MTTAETFEEYTDEKGNVWYNDVLFGWVCDRPSIEDTYSYQYRRRR